MYTEQDGLDLYYRNAVCKSKRHLRRCRYGRRSRRRQYRRFPPGKHSQSNCGIRVLSRRGVLGQGDYARSCETNLRIYFQPSDIIRIIAEVVFVYPLILLFAEFKYIAFPVALFATLAAIREGHFIRTGRTEEK